MKKYEKRIGFIISSQHFILHGGIGTFARAFLDMCNGLNYKVDYILDKEPDNKELMKYIKDNGGNILLPHNSLSNKGHSSRFVFSDTLNLEKSINFRNALLGAYQYGFYDMLIVNSNDAILPTLLTGIQTYLPVIVYSHSGELVFLNDKHDPVFKEAMVDIYRQLMQVDDIIIGTHSDHNNNIISENFPQVDVRTLPLQIADKELLEPYDKTIDRNGVLFVGRFEPRKAPETFLKAVSEAGLKILILTNKTGKEKFVKKLSALGYEEYDIVKDDKNQNNGKVYEIAAGIIGKEKVEFMKKAKLSFQPAVLESYAYSTVEALHCCRTICLEEYNWGKNFKGLASFTNKKTMAKDLKAWHDDDDYDMPSQLAKMQAIFAKIPEYWTTVFDEVKKPITSKKTKLKILLEDMTGYVTMAELFESVLKRDINYLAIDDIEMVYKITDALDIIHTDKTSYVKLKSLNISDEINESTGADAIF